MNGVYLQHAASVDAHHKEALKANEKAELFFLGAREKINRLKEKKDKLMRDLGRLIRLLNTVSEVITEVDIESLLAVLNEHLDEHEEGNFDQEEQGVIIAKLIQVFREIPIRDATRLLMPIGLTLETRFQEWRTGSSVVIQSPESSSEEELNNPTRPLRFRGEAAPPRSAQQILVVPAKVGGAPPPKVPPINIIPANPVPVPKPVPKPAPIQQMPVWHQQARGDVAAYLGPGMEDPWQGN